jgi:hypothetical protein
MQTAIWSSPCDALHSGALSRNGGEVLGGFAISGAASHFRLEKLDELRRIAPGHAAFLSRELGGLA